jgi:hypothetical protein
MTSRFKPFVAFVTVGLGTKVNDEKRRFLEKRLDSYLNFRNVASSFRSSYGSLTNDYNNDRSVLGSRRDTLRKYLAVMPRLLSLKAGRKSPNFRNFREWKRRLRCESGKLRSRTMRGTYREFSVTT